MGLKILTLTKLLRVSSLRSRVRTVKFVGVNVSKICHHVIPGPHMEMANEKVRDNGNDQWFRKMINVAQGDDVIATKLSQMNITFLDISKQSDIAILRGPQSEVNKCYKYLQLHTQELTETGLHVIMDASNNSDMRIIKLIGKKEAIAKALTDMESRIFVLMNDREATSHTNPNHNRQFVGGHGAVSNSILSNCGEMELSLPLILPKSSLPVQKGPEEAAKSQEAIITEMVSEETETKIVFPRGNSEAIAIMGKQEDVNKAKKMVESILKELREVSYTAEVRAKPEFHGFLIGKGGATISKVRESGMRVIFPAPNDPDPEVITIIGKKEAVEKAQSDPECQISVLNSGTAQCVVTGGDHPAFKKWGVFCRPFTSVQPLVNLHTARRYSSSSWMPTGSEMELIITVADHVGVRRSLAKYNKQRRRKPDLEVRDFRLKRVFGYTLSPPNAGDKFAKLVGTQNELCHATLNVLVDAEKMIDLGSSHQARLFNEFGLTTRDIEDLIVSVRLLIVEFFWFEVYD